MNISYKINDKVTLHAEGDLVQDIIKQISACEDVFEDTVCGACGSDDIRFVHRVVDENEFFERKCMKCFAKITFGTSKKDKKLYPRRYEIDAKGKAVRDKDGRAKHIGKNGWVKYNKETGQNE